MEKQQELEWKLQVCDAAAWPQIGAFFRAMPGIQCTKQIDMAAYYFDTEDRVLNRRRAAYRLRQENGEMVATIKAGGSSNGGVHRRLEINVKAASNQPDLSAFRSVAELQSLLAGVREEDLKRIVETVFRREAVLIEYGSTRIEVALDQGMIRAGGKTEPILEVELELKSGSEEDLALLARDLCERFPLRQEEKSKFYRGLLLGDLLGK